jgi:peptide/nickel transport system substrate-binding protein
MSTSHTPCHDRSDESLAQVAEEDVGKSFQDDYSTSETGIVPLNPRRPLWHLQVCGLPCRDSRFNFQSAGTTDIRLSADYRHCKPARSLNRRRRSMTRFTRAVACVVGACSLVLLAACGSSSPATGSNSTKSGNPVRGGDLVFARQDDIVSLDPTQVTDDESIWTDENIFDTLYVSSPNGHELLPDLATGYVLSANHLSWTFHLRHGVDFADGTELTAADVKFSIDRVSAQATNPFGFIDAAIAGITTPNKYTVVITTKYPWAPLLSDMALFANGILPDNFGGESEQQFFAHPYGTGPFKVSQWVKGQKLVLVRNTHYWQKGKPYLNEVTFTDVTNDSTRQLELKAGEADVIESPSYSSISQLQSTSGVKVGNFRSSETEFVLFNESQMPFQDVHVRLAISYALNREAMIHAVLFGDGTEANSFLPPALWAYDSSSPGVQYNLAKAKAEMAESSVPHGFSTTLLVGSGNSTETSLAQIVQQELKPLGITVKLQLLDPDTEETDIGNEQYQMAFVFSTTDIIDPDEMVSLEAMGGNTGQKTHALFTNYNNVSVDNWAEQAERTLSQPARQVLYDKIQVKLAQDAVMAFLYYSPFVYAYSTQVHGLTVYPTGNYPLENVWLGS